MRMTRIVEVLSTIIFNYIFVFLLVLFVNFIIYLIKFN